MLLRHLITLITDARKCEHDEERPALLRHHRVIKTPWRMNSAVISGLVAGSATTGDDLLTMTNSRIVVLLQTTNRNRDLSSNAKAKVTA
jgi:hypothetical protein